MLKTFLFLAFAMGVVLPAQAQTTDSVLDRIKRNNAVSIGHRDASIPFSFLNDQRQPIGYSVDICLNVVEALKQRLEAPNLAVRWVPVNLQNRIPLVANGTADISCDSAVNTIARQSQVDFSGRFFVSTTRLLVRAGSGIREVEDLNGKAVALPINSVPERLVRALIQEKNLNVRIVPVRDNSEGFLALSTNRVDAFSTDDILLHGLRHNSQNPAAFEVVGRALSFDSYGLLVQKNNTHFLSLVNATIARLVRSGEMDRIYEKWFGPMGIPMSPELAAALRLEAIPE